MLVVLPDQESVTEILTTLTTCKCSISVLKCGRVLQKYFSMWCIKTQYFFRV